MTPEEKLERKLKKKYGRLRMAQLSDEEKIVYLNMPWNQLPEDLKPCMVKRPQTFNFIRMQKPNIGEQRERFGARLIKYRRDYNLTTKRFIDVCNEYAKKYDSAGQRTRITELDLENYECGNVSPKIDKMMVISKVTGLPLDYFAGYGPDRRSPGRNVIRFPNSPNNQSGGGVA